MDDLLIDQQDAVLSITLNRTARHNAFNKEILEALLTVIAGGVDNPDVRVLVLKAAGPHFCAGADLSWMQEMASFSEEDNLQDALVLSRLMYTLYQCPKPTLALVQGSAFGGGAGLAAACDIVCAATDARFCFSEVKLGLIPAVISPYVIKAIGERAATHLFMTAEIFDAEKARQLQLVQYIADTAELHAFGMKLAGRLSASAPIAVPASKALIRQITGRPIDNNLMEETAALIAKIRVSREGQIGLNAFLNKTAPQWN